MYTTHTGYYPEITSEQQAKNLCAELRNLTGKDKAEKEVKALIEKHGEINYAFVVELAGIVRREMLDAVQNDLGHRVIISGGEVLDIDNRTSSDPDAEIPF